MERKPEVVRLWVIPGREFQVEFVGTLTLGNLQTQGLPGNRSAKPPSAPTAPAGARRRPIKLAP